MTPHLVLVLLITNVVLLLTPRHPPEYVEGTLWYSMGLFIRYSDGTQGTLLIRQAGQHYMHQLFRKCSLTYKMEVFVSHFGTTFVYCDVHIHEEVYSFSEFIVWQAHLTSIE